jgi:hypothetical protein
MKKLLFVIALTITLVSCKETTEQETAKPDKKGSREVLLSCVVQKDSTLHIITQKFWVNNVLMQETFTTKTPNLPNVNDTIEDENGEMKVINHEAKFPIFVTVQ